MIVTAIQCEQCPKTHHLGQAVRAIPDGWVVLFKQGKEDQHFCSYLCLAKWLEVTPAQPISGLLEAPATKMRRFLLVDGETADETEGIVWGNGSVTLAYEMPTSPSYKGRPLYFNSWEEFKEKHPGDGVTWIDQEVRKEVPA